MSQPNGSPEFVVSTSQKVLSDLKTIIEGSKRGAKIIRIAKEIDARLKHDARDFGEPLYNLKHLQLQIRFACLAPLCVEFGGHWVRDLVFVRRFTEM